MSEYRISDAERISEAIDALTKTSERIADALEALANREEPEESDVPIPGKYTETIFGHGMVEGIPGQARHVMVKQTEPKQDDGEAHRIIMSFMAEHLANHPGLISGYIPLEPMLGYYEKHKDKD